MGSDSAPKKCEMKHQKMAGKTKKQTKLIRTICGST